MQEPENVDAGRFARQASRETSSHGLLHVKHWDWILNQFWKMSQIGVNF